MGILGRFGGSPEEKARKLKARVTQKYGDPTGRQKAIAQLGEMRTPEAVRSLMARFTITVDPHTTDADEKEQVFELVKAFGADAVPPVREFLQRVNAASSWALRLLEALLPENELIGVAIDTLRAIGNEYTRDPEKKTVLLHYLAGKSDPRVAPAVLPFLEDPSDDVKIAAITSLAPRRYEPAREPLLHLVTTPEIARRVKSAAIAALHESELGVQGFREKVEAALSDPYFIDKGGVIKKRG
ncbi:MAG TPA: HEAT repeat domain-containing protein [Myxococcaceae bacterium]|nr:HEAT repeat domain-containing protein [Myxococcaceae bacterium]